MESSFHYEDGSKYQGNYIEENGIPIRQGIGIFVSPSFKAEGQWQNDMLIGKGKVEHFGHSTYIGDFENSKMNGYGEMSWNDGTKYIGEWKDDTFNGKGEYIDEQGVKWKGYFENGKGYNLQHVLNVE